MQSRTPESCTPNAGPAEQRTADATSSGGEGFPGPVRAGGAFSGGADAAGSRVLGRPHVTRRSGQASLMLFLVQSSLSDARGFTKHSSQIPDGQAAPLSGGTGRGLEQQPKGSKKDLMIGAKIL